MKIFKITLLVLLFPLITASTTHKFYVSITKIEYVAESESLQIINQMFIDDIEDVLQERYNQQVSLGTSKETESDAAFLEEYLLQKLKITVDDKPVAFNYLGKEYETDLVKSYIEVLGVKDFKTIEIENKALMDLFPEQQNIIHVKVKNSRKSVILDTDNPKGLLNFD